MLVRCKHYSTLYPNGPQNLGDIFDITKNLAEYYKELGWVEILPLELQPKAKAGKRKKEINFVTDLSKSVLVDKNLIHNFSHKK